MPILYQIIISVIISAFWSSQAIEKINISVETIAVTLVRLKLNNMVFILKWILKSCSVKNNLS